MTTVSGCSHSTHTDQAPRRQMCSAMQGHQGQTHQPKSQMLNRLKKSSNCTEMLNFSKIIFSYPFPPPLRDRLFSPFVSFRFVKMLLSQAQNWFQAGNPLQIKNKKKYKNYNLYIYIDWNPPAFVKSLWEMNFGTLPNFSAQATLQFSIPLHEYSFLTVSFCCLFVHSSNETEKSLAGQVLLWWAGWHVLLLADTPRCSLRRWSASKLAPLFPDFPSSSPGRPIASEARIILHPTFNLVGNLLRSLLRCTIVFSFGRGNDVGAMLPKRLNRNWRRLLWGLLANFSIT